tara:strand:- start:393 stop:638 length:246 start_codon:yes stop_codon:yes gene_type:complete
MTISIESIKKYAEGLKADLLKAKDRKEQAVQSVNEADSQVKLLDGALQFANLLIQDSAKTDVSSAVEGVINLEGEAEQPNP